MTTQENPVTQDQADQPEPSVCTGACCAQPDGIDPDSYDLPDPAAAAERVGDFLTEFGDGMITVYELDKLEGVPPLYARDLEALRKLAADDELIHVSLLHNAGFDVCTACNGSGFRNGVECAECSLRRIKPRTAAQAPAASEQDIDTPCTDCWASPGEACKAGCDCLPCQIGTVPQRDARPAASGDTTGQASEERQAIVEQVLRGGLETVRDLRARIEKALAFCEAWEMHHGDGDEVLSVTHDIRAALTVTEESADAAASETAPISEED